MGKTVEERLETLEHIQIRMDTELSVYKTDQIENKRTQNRMTFTVIALVAALVGKDIIVAGLGHTPPLEVAWFWMTGLFFIGYIVWLFMYMMLWANSRVCATIAAMSMLVAALFRYELGFLEGGSPEYSWFIGAPLLIGSFAFCCETFTVWKKTWRKEWKSK